MARTHLTSLGVGSHKQTVASPTCKTHLQPPAGLGHSPQREAGAGVAGAIADRRRSERVSFLPAGVEVSLRQSNSDDHCVHTCLPTYRSTLQAWPGCCTHLRTVGTVCSRCIPTMCGLLSLETTCSFWSASVFHLASI